ncbi:MAG: hypothetical protein A4E45_01130 [Methanosaeta sp. PtaB.Bin039]|nr:MAG: hypothetical protein A4E45_01130 [Methanosaeta sp. PtaB.Bin039]HOT07229.1 hypothetical protein [Methanotrichaceae archaeon]HQF17257.1 hypothetical protein [Methanotrichaceae archaeon]HQI91830.1 hypothetical protein [Methanotrichaceae archaeon]HQJ29160.1 hypothetical protein [Methanotrichaceae archaeon]
MELKAQVQEFLKAQSRTVKGELASKYGVPPEELEEVAAGILETTFGPALMLARQIESHPGAVLLFIGRQDCPICSDDRPVVEAFLSSHRGVRREIRDYTEPEGLIYHMLNREDQGMLPLIALISGGQVAMLHTGKRLTQEDLERGYHALQEPLDCRPKAQAQIAGQQ